VICDRCAKPTSDGEHGIGRCPLLPQRQYAAVIADDVPGGFWAENGFDAPRKFYSKSAHRAALAAEGCEIRAKWAGPHDNIMTNWAATISAHQLESAKILLSRGKVKVAEAEAFVPDPIVKAVVKGPYPEGVEHG
jgi:hypothetical protein